jgi:hypothetical protein
MSNLSKSGPELTMCSFADLQLKPDVLARYALPDLLYPVPADELDALAGCKDDLPLSVLLYGLQQSAGDGNSHWKELEAAMRRLAELLAPADDRTVVIAAGADWWLEIGPVDLNQKVVTVQRGNDLVAAMTPREDGRLRVSAFRPLDAKSAGYLIALSQVPDPEHGVAMRDNNWEYALDGSAANGNNYAADRGEAYLSYWEKGIGFSWDGTEVSKWRSQAKLVPRRPAAVAVELGVHNTLSG